MRVVNQIKAAFASNSPGRVVRAMKLLEDEGDTLIVRMYFLAEGKRKLIPTPYQNLRFCKNTQQLSDLSPDEEDRYTIRNYK